MALLMIPNFVKKVISGLQKHNFEAFIVGGCVRDLLLGKKPKDWDVATNARPEEIQKIFPDSFYKNKFGTVTVKITRKIILHISPPPSLKEGGGEEGDGEVADCYEVEVTTYRIDEKYSDKRHPDKVQFTDSLAKDLGRRDFTINAMALDLKHETWNMKHGTEFGLTARDSKKKSHKLPSFVGAAEGRQITNYKLIDPFAGHKDLKQKLIRAVGKPQKRFQEDALRLMRAVRFACELDFQIEAKTFAAVKENTSLLRAIAKERVRDEVIKIIMSEQPNKGILLLKDTSLLSYVIPELERGVGVSQNRHHIYTIFEHSVLSLKYAAQYNFSLEVRLAALFHDIAKPQTKQGEGPDATFYAHDALGAKFTIRILERLRFPKKVIEKVAHLVRRHMFFYDESVTEAGVRRLLRRVGPENFSDLMDLRIADRLGSGCPKAKPYKLRHLEYLIEKVSRDPISPKMLKANGNDVMRLLKIQPGPRVGLILNALLSEVLDEPAKNKPAYLEKRILGLDKLTDSQLKSAVKKVEEKKEEVDLEIKQRHWVK